MNLDRYEKIDGWQALERFKKIDGWQALERFKDGKNAFCYHKNEFHEVVMARQDLYSAPVSREARQKFLQPFTINEILGRGWYIPKPFDVRQAMLERPNEWVAAYNDERGTWIQVGFDTVSMRPIKAYYGYSGLVKGATAQQATSFELDACIPIEDVPEEATR